MAFINLRNSKCLIGDVAFLLPSSSKEAGFISFANHTSNKPLNAISASKSIQFTYANEVLNQLGLMENASPLMGLDEEILSDI